MALVRLGPPRRSTSSRPSSRSRSIGAAPALLLGTAGLLSVGALALGGSASDEPDGGPGAAASQPAAARSGTADLAALAAPAPTTLAPIGPVPDVVAIIPPGQAAGVAPSAVATMPATPRQVVARPAASRAPGVPQAHATPAPARASAPATATATPTPRGDGAVLAASEWRDPGESLERACAVFLLLAAVLGGFVVWLRRNHARGIG